MFVVNFAPEDIRYISCISHDNVHRLAAANVASRVYYIHSSGKLLVCVNDNYEKR